MTGTDNDAPIHQSLAASMLRNGSSLNEVQSRLLDILGRPLTSDERVELLAAMDKADALAAERGPDYRGFGNPPSPPE